MSSDGWEKSHPIFIFRVNNIVMKTINEIEKRLECEAGFRSIQSLEAMIPETEHTDEKEESIEEWIRINIGEEYLDKKYE